MNFALIVSMLFGFGAGKAVAETPALSPLCNPSAIYGKLIPAPAMTTTERLINDALIDITHHESKFIPEISQKLLAEQAKHLKAAGVPFRMGPGNRWLDILPRAKGPALNQLAYHMGNKEGTRHLLRYSPEILFDDAYAYEDLVLSYRQRALYLSHQDVLKLSAQSEYFARQTSFAEVMNEFDKKIGARQMESEGFDTQAAMNRQFLKPISEKDYLTDFNKSNFVNPPHAPYERAKYRMDEIIRDYLKKTPDLTLIVNREDPLVTRIGPFKRMRREQYGVPIVDIHGAKKVIYNLNDFRISELSGPVDQSRSVYDIFVQDSFRDHRMNGDNLYRRALVLPDGRALAHISGSPGTKEYFESYLQFLKTIYTDPNGLAIAPEVYEKLKAKSLEFTHRSQVIVRTKTKDWILNKDAKEITGGLILVKSENPSQILPMREAHPNLALNQPENEVWVEAGRLGSLTPEDTIQFLKVAGVSLHYQHPDQTVRIICEASKSRAKLFRRFGFTEAPIKVDGPSYYPDGTELVLQVTLEDFLKHVLK